MSDAKRRGPLPAVAAFVVEVAIIVAATIALLSSERPFTREHDPETQDAYIGGDTVPVAARVQGYLTTLPIADEQMVHAGDVLAQIEQDDYHAQVDQAQAQLAAAEAQVAGVAARQTQLTAKPGRRRRSRCRSRRRARAPHPSCGGRSS